MESPYLKKTPISRVLQSIVCCLAAQPRSESLASLSDATLIPCSVTDFCTFEKIQRVLWRLFRSFLNLRGSFPILLSDSHAIPVGGERSGGYWCWRTFRWWFAGSYLTLPLQPKRTPWLSCVSSCLPPGAGKPWKNSHHHIFAPKSATRGAQWTTSLTQSFTLSHSILKRHLSFNPHLVTSLVCPQASLPQIS